MGCIVSKTLSAPGGDGTTSSPPFTDAATDQDDDDDVHSRRELDRAAIEEQSHINGEQSLLALVINAKPERDQISKTAPLRALERSGSEASPRERATLDADGTAATPAAPVASHTVLNLVTSPVKIRIQEPHSSAITTDEHEHSKLLPDIKYSMRGAPLASAGGGLHQQQTENVAGLFGQPGILSTQLGPAGNHQQPFNGARKLQPITTTAITSSQRSIQQMPVLGMALPDRMNFGQHQLGVGRGPVVAAGRGGFAGPISPLYRGPVQVVGSVTHTGTAGRGGVITGGPRGIPRPLHVIAARSGGSQRGQTTFRQFEAEHTSPVQQAHSAQPSTTGNEISSLGPGKKSANNGSDDGDDDDDDDFVADDDEVGDWDLDGDDTAVEEPKTYAQQRVDSPTKVTMMAHNSTFPSSTESPMLFKKQPPHPIQTSHSLASRVSSGPPSPPREAPPLSKFRPAHGMANDLGDLGIIADSQLDDDGDDDDSNFGDENEDVEDWFEADSSAESASIRVKKASPSAHELKTDTIMLKSVPGSLAMHVAPTMSPAMTPIAFRHAPSSSEAFKPSPHPPPMQRLPSRQFINPGNTSPVKNPATGIGSPTVGSPIKQVSYRSSIVSATQPVLLSMAPVLGVAPGVNAPIRDTKVVKKKRAELPQRNLPHPTPKFGDWLNSRTMINNYIILEALGSGSYAEVKLCKEKVSGKLFAMKFINRDIMKKDKLGKQSKLDDIKREIAIMKKLNHPNVLRLYEVMDDPSMNKLFLVLEYMKHGDLLSHQKKKHAASSSSGTGGGEATTGNAMESLHDRDLHCVFLQVVLGLAYLHEQKIVHGDIKPQNILVGDKDAVKIADFGISQSLYGSKQKLTDTAGTPAFMSPEMCSGEEYSGQLADIWAVGATFFMLKFGNPPFVAKSAMQMFEKIQNDPLVFPFAIDPLLQDLLTGMMVKGPQQRMTLLEVMGHPWVTKEETMSNYSATTTEAQTAPRITVSNDEIEHAIHSKDQFAIIVNIRIQMMKKLQKARQEMRQRLVHEVNTESMSFAGSVWGGAPAVTRDAPKKAVKLKSPKLKPSNKVHADHHSHSNGVVGATGVQDEDPLHHQMLSNEEINYRAQLFSRKKTGSTAVPSGAGGGGKSRDQGSCGFETDADLGSGSADTDDDGGDDDEDDDDALSSDDDEAAVAQSPQLLDELLLTTLSMPPLTKTKSVEEEPRNQDLTTSDHTNGVLHTEAANIQTTHTAASMVSDKDGYGGESSMLGLQFGVASLQGRRSTQEDRWVVLPEINGDMAPKWATSAFVGLFDGHGGEECSNILHEQLHSWIFRDPHDLTLTPAILQTRFEELDTYVCDYLLQKGDLSGSTATCVILSPSDAEGKIRAIVAHVGDCRLVLSLRNNEVRDVTEDHRLTMSSERDRILALGGRVVNSRVNGVMAITRAFGDLEFKGLLGRKSGAASSSSSSSMSLASSSSIALIPATVQQNPFQSEEEKIPALLTARPDVHTLELDPRVHEFLLLACDGLWDVMTSEEAAEIFRDRLHFHGNLQLAAKELAQEAIRRYSNDNITVVAIQLGL